MLEMDEKLADVILKMEAMNTEVTNKCKEKVKQMMLPAGTDDNRMKTVVEQYLNLDAKKMLQEIMSTTSGREESRITAIMNVFFGTDLQKFKKMCDVMEESLINKQ